MHLSYIAPQDHRLEDLDGGRARPIRALILTAAVAFAALTACEAMSPGVLTNALSIVTG